LGNLSFRKRRFTGTTRLRRQFEDHFRFCGHSTRNPRKSTPRLGLVIYVGLLLNAFRGSSFCQLFNRSRACLAIPGVPQFASLVSVS
jgi:hypothetical protein